MADATDESAAAPVASADADAGVSSSSGSDASASADSGSGLTDAHHDWVQSTLGADPRAYDAGSAAASAPGAAAAGDSGGSGGLWGSITGGISAAASSVENAVSSVANTVSDGAAAVASSVESVAGQATDQVSAAAGAVSSAAGAAYDTVADAADTAANALASTGAVGAAIAGTARDVVGFNKGLVEGVYEGGKGLVTGVAHGVAAVAKEGYALATDANARQDALNTLESGAEAVGNFEAKMVTDPGGALQDVGDAASHAASTVANAATSVYHSYEEAAAAGHGAEFLGKGVGQAAVLVGGALIPGVGEAEAGVVAAEGAVMVGEGAAALGEGVAIAGEVGAETSEAAAVASEAGEAASTSSELASGSAEATEAESTAGMGSEVVHPVEPAPSMPAEEPIPETVGQDGSQLADAGDGGSAGGGNGGGQGGGEPPGEPPSSAGRPAAQSYTMPDDPEALDAGAQATEAPEPPSPDSERDSALADEVAEDMNSLQELHGQNQIELPDESVDPNLDEPNRMPELDQGPDPVRRDVSLRDVHATQADVSATMGDGSSIEEVQAGMKDNGWDSTRPDPDMVQNADGSLDTLDHRRLVAAEGAEIEEVPALVHAADEPLPEDMEGRFSLKDKFTDPETGLTHPKGTDAETWGEAAKFRSANQGKAFPESGQLPSIRDNIPKPGLPETPSLSERANEALRAFSENNPEAKDAISEFDSAEEAREADLESITE